MWSKEKVLKGLNALYESMHKNQCYACSYEFIETEKEFGTEILAEAEELINSQPEIVRCEYCVYWDKGHSEECDNSDSVCFHNGRCKPDWFCADGEHA